MGSRLWTVVVDAHDPAALARFWASVLDWTIFYGAQMIDIGQGDVAWTVLADPEGNEFCVLRSRDGGV